ncbi:MAG: fibronectin type III domain-containing protein, partial [Pseudomonadales bacterium]|nr:fibronectin type III domain-containing protein [Pseudomonadales bacterium]
FRVERSRNGASFQPIDVLGSNSTQYIDTNTDPGIDYQYRVVAFNDNGDAEVSNIASITSALRSNATTTAIVNSSGGGSSTSWPTLFILWLFAVRKYFCSVKPTR